MMSYLRENEAENPQSGDVARGKFVSGAKVLTAVQSISQPRSFLSNFSY